MAQQEVRRSQRDYYDAHQHSSVLNENELVLLYKPSRQLGVATKLPTHWIGPFKVVRCIRDELYVIEEPTAHVHQFAHVQRLARYYPYTDPQTASTSAPVQPPPDNQTVDMVPSPEECDIGDFLILNDPDDCSKWYLTKAIETTCDTN